MKKPAAPMASPDGRLAPRAAHSRGQVERRSAPRPPVAQAHIQLGRALDRAAQAATADAVARDPLRFPRRYLDARGGLAPTSEPVAPVEPADVEIAAVYAAQLAFGRVELFGPVLERLFAEQDAAGGPLAWARRCRAGQADRGDPLVYRWFSRPDFVALGAALAQLYDAPDGLRSAFTPPPSGPGAARGQAALEQGVSRLHAAARATSRQREGAFFDTWFAVPSSGSACKRWCMFLRWMVRDGAPDLGLWRHLAPGDLVIPVDTHVLRIAQLTGLTERKAANWRTALDITERLRRYAPADPVRYDFALAHLGISAGCTGAVSSACDACAMRPVCRVHPAAPNGAPGKR